jgi:hypothetical protein
MPVRVNGEVVGAVGVAVLSKDTDPSLTCNVGTLTGSYRTADDPDSANYDGLHWYIVVPKPAGIGAGGCWVEATIVVEFIRATPGNRARRKCPASGTIAFHHGK